MDKQLQDYLAGLTAKKLAVNDNIFIGMKKREENGWYEKNNSRNTDPEYLAKLSDGKKNSETFKEARKKLKNNNDFKQSIQDGLAEFNKNNPGHKQAQIERTIKQNQDPAWLEAVTAGNRRKQLNKEHVAKMDSMYKSNNWKQAHWNGLHSPEGRANHRKGVIEKICKPILSIEYGPFISIHAAAEFYFENKLTSRNSLESVKSWLGALLRKEQSVFKKITKEEYIMLTGQDI